MGREYLSNWGIQQAMREIYQNFLDYGDYTEDVDNSDEHTVIVSVSNDWAPESLDFLRIGNSKKHNPDAIGKHGEGVKMAFLILERLGMKSQIVTHKYVIEPAFNKDPEIGDCFCLNYTTITEPADVPRFTVVFECPAADYAMFKDNVIVGGDILFSHEYGDIVDKDAGSIYSGGLFVTRVKNMSKAYNIKPRYLPLDRDRCAPGTFDLNYHASKINESHGEITVEDLTHSDTMYTSAVSDKVKSQITPKMVGNSVEFVIRGKNGTEDKIIKNDYLKESFKKDSFFEKIIKKIRLHVAKKLGLYDLLLEFKDNHVHTTDAKADFELILARVENAENRVEELA